MKLCISREEPSKILHLAPSLSHHGCWQQRLDFPPPHVVITKRIRKPSREPAGWAVEAPMHEVDAILFNSTSTLASKNWPRRQAQGEGASGRREVLMIKFGV
jgi:hypothetical protein